MSKLYTHSTKRKNLKGFIPTDGRSFKKEDYPEMFEFLNSQVHRYTKDFKEGEE